MGLPARIVLVAFACLLFWLGWSHWQPPAVRSAASVGTLVVRPLPVTVNGQTKDLESLGVVSMAVPSQVTLEREGWGKAEVSLVTPGSLMTARLSAPKARVDARTYGEVPVALTTLPSKKKLQRVQGSVLLAPGRHSLLAEAEGFIPKVVTIELAPGEKKTLQVALKEIPRPIFSLPPPGSLSSPPRQGLPDAGWDSPPETGRYVPPEPAYVPAEPIYAPEPGFTPVAPPEVAEPAPVFTPVP